MIYDQILDSSQKAIDNAHHIVVIQADNPDGDSLSSALALESILGEAGKEVSLYCAIDVPEHLRYLEGWDRVSKDFPNNYDLAILVDCAFWRLLEHFEDHYGRGTLVSSKLMILDEHDTSHDVEAANDVHDVEAVASAQIVYELFSRLGYSFSKQSVTFIASGIMSDTLGFTSEVMVGKPRPFEVMAKLVEFGLDLGELQDKRFERMKISPDILRYKGELLSRVEYFSDGRIATVTIPYDEIRDKSQEFNPTVILDECRLVEGVAVTVGFKQYVRDGRLIRVTGRIRCNRGYHIADALAKVFPDGGGHPYAAGFKIEGNDLNFDEIKQKTITEATRLLNEALQHSD